MLRNDGAGKALMPPLQTVDRATQVSEALARFIESADLKAGDRLPAERELMDALGVGRSTIREVVRRFQALGVMETRKGSGTYLLKPVSADTVHMPLSFESSSLRDTLLQSLEVRRGLEVEVSVLAARRRTPDDLRKLEHALNEMERVHLSEGAAGPQDQLFHLAIYDAAHNPLFRQLLEQMRGIFSRFFENPVDRKEFAARSFPFHRTLFNAIAAQDTEAARRETLKILEVVEEDIKDMAQ